MRVDEPKSELQVELSTEEGDNRATIRSDTKSCKLYHLADYNISRLHV